MAILPLERKKSIGYGRFDRGLITVHFEYHSRIY